ncbi:MAG: hypothetical protein V1664_00010 [Candidatus Uhrbacteria bacterium]
MKSPWLWASLIIFGVAGLFLVSRIMTPLVQPPKEQTSINQNTLPAATETPPAVTEENPNKLPDGWQKIDDDDFTINLPKIWLVSKDEAYQISSDKFSTKYFLASGQSNNTYNDPNIVNLDVSLILKNEKTFEEIITAFGHNEEEAAAAVKLMQAADYPPYHELTINDIKISREDTILNNGTLAKKIIFQCLNECYLDGQKGLVKTKVQYFVETPNTVLEFSINMPTYEKTEALLLVAEQIIKTLEIK